MTSDEWTSRAKALLGFAALRFGGALALSTAATLGGVYFIVDMSLGSLRQSIDVTNKRIDDVRVSIEKSELSIKEFVSLKLENLESRIKIESNQTRDVIRRGSLDLKSNDFFASNKDTKYAQALLSKEDFSIIFSKLKTEAKNIDNIAVFPLITNNQIDSTGASGVIEDIIFNDKKINEYKATDNLKILNELYPNCVKRIYFLGSEARFEIGSSGIKLTESTIGCTSISKETINSYFSKKPQ